VPGNYYIIRPIPGDEGQIEVIEKESLQSVENFLNGCSNPDKGDGTMRKTARARILEQGGE